MGKERYDIDGGLDGYKDDLIENLRKNFPPSWLYPSTPRSTDDDRLGPNADTSDFLQACREIATGDNDSLPPRDGGGCTPSFRVYVDRQEINIASGFRHYATTAPRDIRERIESWVGENERRIMYENEYAEFKVGPRVRVELDASGEVQDAWLEMVYGN